MIQGLSKKQVKEVEKIISNFQEIETVTLFGSRTLGTFKEASDIDLAIDGKDVNAKTAINLKSALEDETFLPFFFDVVAVRSIDNPELTKHIKKHGEVIYGLKRRIKGEWGEQNLEDLAELSKDSWKVNDESLPYIALEHIDEGKLRLNSFGSSDEVASNKYLFNEDTFLFGKLRPYFRKLVRPTFRGICSTDIWVVKSKGGYDLDYLFYLFANQEFVDLSYNGSSGTRMPRADWNFMKDTKWVVPSSIDEQKAIAGVLSSLDDKIDLLHRQNKTLESLAETLFRHTFIDNAQDNWEPISLGDLVKTNASTIKSSYGHETIQYLDTGSITEGVIEGYQEFALADAPSRAKRLVQHNDIIVSTVRPNQKHYGIIKTPIANLVVSTGFCVLTCDKIDPHFVYTFLTNEEMTEHLHMIADASTSTYPSLKPSDIESLEFQLPPQPLLDEFENIADAHWEKIEQNYNKIQTLGNLRDTLLPKLMSGEIRVQYDEAT